MTSVDSADSAVANPLQHVGGSQLGMESRVSSSVVGTGSVSTVSKARRVSSMGIEDSRHGRISADLLTNETDGERKIRLERMSRNSTFVAIVPKNNKYMTTFMLLNYMIGAGILNQPYVVKKAGIGGALCGFAVATYMTFRAVNYLTECAMEHQIFDYSALAKHAFGAAGEKVIDISISLGGFGGVVSYVVVVGGVMSDLLQGWGCGNEICEPIPVILISVGLFVAPICLYRHFGHLTVLAIFSIVAIWTVLFLVIIGGSFYQVPTDNNLTLFNPQGMLSSLGSMILALSLCTGNFQAFVSTEKKSQNINDWSHVTASAISLGSIMCLGMGISGYLYFRQDTDGVIINNFTAPEFDFFKVMIVCHLICYIPAAFVIMRYSVVKLVLNQISEDLPPMMHTGISLGLVALITGVVVMLQALGLSSGEAFSLVLDLTGGVAGSLTSFILPAAIYVQLMPDNGSWRYKEAKCIFYIGIILMITILFVTIHGVV